jgi:hypothetical protein
MGRGRGGETRISVEEWRQASVGVLAMQAADKVDEELRTPRGVG